MQVSPSGMAAASQAVPGEFDSRHLLQKKRGRISRPRFFWYSIEKRVERQGAPNLFRGKEFFKIITI